MFRQAASFGGVLLLAACGGLTEQEISGTINDEAIQLEAQSAGPSVWLELTNQGTQDCELLVVLSESDPAALPVMDGQVAVSQSGAPGEAYPAEAYTEIDGVPAAEDPDYREGELTRRVVPGETVRVQVAMTGTPDAAERIVLCNGAGDYEAGRYAVLRFDR